MRDRRHDIFSPLHREQPPHTWDRIASGGERLETSPYIDATGRRSPTRRLLAAAVLVAVCIGAGALLARGGGSDTVTFADGSSAPSSDIAASGPCPFELSVPDLGAFVPVEGSTLLERSQVSMLGEVTILRSEQDDQVIEVLAGAFDEQTFQQAAVAIEGGPTAGPGEEISTVVPFTPASPTCGMWGIYATGLDEATYEAVRSTAIALGAR